MNTEALQHTAQNIGSFSDGLRRARKEHANKLVVTKACHRPYFRGRTNYELWDLKRTNIRTFEPLIQADHQTKALACFQIIYNL